MSVLIPVLIVIHVAVCLLMLLVVLMQRPRSEGLGAAFGGGMTDNLFGAQTTHVLQKFTVWLGCAFFALTLLIAILFARNTAGSTTIQRELLEGAPASEAVPAVPAAEESGVTAPEGASALPSIEIEAVNTDEPVSPPANTSGQSEP